MDLRERVSQAFHSRYGAAPPLIVRAPGRVNLIGEHTDYNDGFVLPMAIDRAVWIALRPRTDSYVIAYAAEYDEVAEFSLGEMVHRHGLWAEYIKGVAWALQEAGHALTGWEGVVLGDVPIGAGLSSSAAIELASARAFASTSGLPWDAAEMAKIAQRAENEWVGMKSGIMDQMISAVGEAGRALLIDCRWLTTDAVPLPPETVVVILDTSTRRALVTSAYNERRSQCEAAAQFFGVPALRDLDITRFDAAADLLDPVVAKRARHVITENARALQAAAAMRAGDAGELGRLMNASHVSLRDDFAVSRAELDTMVEIAQTQPGCYGARMTGAGFGGCAVALVAAANAAAFTSEVGAKYAAATGKQPAIYVTTAQPGAAVVQGA
jgi:galactokinase